MNTEKTVHSTYTESLPAAAFLHAMVCKKTAPCCRNSRKQSSQTFCYSKNSQPHQFLKEWIGAGILPLRLISRSQPNLLTGMIGA